MSFTHHDNADALLITACKGRLSHLKRALPTWLTQQTRIPYGITLIDWDCPDNAAQWAAIHAPPGIQILRTAEPQPEYSHAKPKNAAARHTTAPILVFIDADNLLDPLWLTTAIASIYLGDADYCESLWTPGCKNPGTVAITRDLHEHLRGFDESFIGWGGTDKDYYLRASVHGRKVTWDTTRLQAIQHDEASRTRFYPIKSTAESHAGNEARITSWTRRVNPDGYGLTPLATVPHTLLPHAG